MTLNPSAPDTIGLEWFPWSEGTDPLASAAAARAFLLHSHSAETIDQLILPHSWSGAATGFAKAWVDVYDANDVGAGATETVYSYVPNADVARSNTTQSDFSTTTNLYQQVDDADDTGSVDNDYVVNSSYWASGSWWRFELGTSSFPANTRPLAVTFEVRAKGFDWSWQQPTIQLELWYNGTKVTNLGSPIYPPQDYTFRTYSIGPFYLDPRLEAPWSRQQILNMDGPNLLQLRLTLNYACAVSRVGMKVRTIPEKRVAMGGTAKSTTLPVGVQTNRPFMLQTPAEVDNWAKAAGKDYLVVVRRLEDPTGATAALQPNVLYVDAGTPHPDGQGQVVAVTLEDQSGKISAVGATATKCYAPILGTSGGAQSADEQPYHDVVSHAVHGSSTVTQGVNGANGQSYRRVRALVAVGSSPPDAALTFKVKRTSDDVQIGGDGTLAVADLANAAIATTKGSFGTLTVYDVVVTLASSAVLASATDYYVEVSSAAAPATPWYLLGIDQSASHALTGNHTYGGSTLRGSVAGTGDDDLDFPMTVQATPNAPISVTASCESVPLPDVGQVLTDPGSLSFARVTWVPDGSLGSSFSRYEVERSEDGGTTWSTIAYVTTEADTDFDDYEGLRNTALAYRVRVVRADGAQSDYTESNTVTCGAAGCVLFFVSNENPDASVGYPTLGDTTEFQFPEADELVVMRMHYRDFQVAFRPLEDRGVTWTKQLLIYSTETGGDGLAPPDGAGFSAFDTLRALARSSSIAVLNPEGQRIFAALRVPTGSQMEPAHMYVANVEIIQVGDTPSVVTV